MLVNAKTVQGSHVIIFSILVDVVPVDDAWFDGLDDPADDDAIVQLGVLEAGDAIIFLHLQHNKTCQPLHRSWSYAKSQPILADTVQFNVAFRPQRP